MCPCTKIHQEQVVAGITTQQRVENPAVQEQVIVPEIPQAPQVQIAERIQEQIAEPIDVQSLAVTYAAHSQQLPSIIKAVATGVNLDMTSLVNPQFSIAGVEVSAPQVSGSLPPCARVQPSPSGTYCCKGDDPEHCGNPLLCKNR